MAWTAPRVWTVGQVVLAAELNVDIQENMLVLSTHAHGGGAGDGDDQLSGVDDIIFDDVSAPAAPGAGDSRLYFVSGVPHARVGGSGADHPLAPDAKGEILSHDGTVPTQLSVGSDNTFLEADSSESTGLKWTSGTLGTIARKSADETVNASTTMQNDDALLFAVGTNETWMATLFLTYDSGTTPDIKVTWALPAGATGRHASNVVNVGNVDDYVTGDATGTLSMAGGGAGVKRSALINIQIRTGGTSGNVQLQWAQNTSDASDTKVRQESCIVAWKVA